MSEVRTAGTDYGMLHSVQWSSRRGRWRVRTRWLLTGERHEPRPAWTGLYEPPGEDRDDVGVCCSGGGLQSAAFNLGVLQVLQADERRLLQRSKYLAAVSGGAYAAAAVAMVAKTRSRPGDDDSDPELVHDDAPPFAPGSPEERHLRAHLGHLVPVGFGRVDLAVRLAVGLIVNMVLIGMPVFFCGLIAGWFARVHYGSLRIDPALCDPRCHYAIHVPPGVLWLVGGAAAVAVTLAVLAVVRQPAREISRLALETWEARFFLLAAGGGLMLVVVPWLAAEALDFRGVTVHKAALSSAGAALSSIGALFLAAFGQVRGRLRDEQRAVEEITGALGRHARGLRELLVAAIVPLACAALPLAVAVLGVLVAVVALPAHAADAFGAGLLGRLTPEFAMWLGGSALALVLLWLFVDLNAVSLHPYYRRRLEQAIALKRVHGFHGAVAAMRRPDRGVALSRSGVEPAAYGPGVSPMLIVCAAARVPGRGGLGGGTASFTFSQTAIGGPDIGAAPTAYYESDLPPNRRRDITLPAVVATSGAALAPAARRLSDRPLTLLLGLASMRLGVWVPNPADMNDRHERRRLPLWHRAGPRYLFREALGRTRSDDRFLYVTDGGDYESLGLLELLRRGCRTIYCFDAGTSTRALVDAIMLARVELGVEITMEPEADALAEDRETGLAGRCCARGRIRYPAASDAQCVDGTLLYARATVTPDAPWDLRSYHRGDDRFPHHSTLDGSFDDRRFEAYRSLGTFAAQRLLELEPLHGRSQSAGPGPAPGDGDRAGNGSGPRPTGLDAAAEADPSGA